VSIAFWALEPWTVELMKCSTWNICIRSGSLLVVEAEEKDDAEDDRSQKDLTDVIVQDLLIGVGGVAEGGLVLCLRGGNGVGRDADYVLVVHVLTPLAET
jgi:hypothetical protein